MNNRTKQHVLLQTVNVAFFLPTIDEPGEEEFLLQEMLDCESLFHTGDSTNAKFGSPTKIRNFKVSVNPFIQKLLLHCKLNYDAEVTGVLATSLAEVTFTTWTMQVCTNIGIYFLCASTKCSLNFDICL